MKPDTRAARTESVSGPRGSQKDTKDCGNKNAGADYASLFDVFQSLRQNSTYPGGIVDPKYHAMFDELNAATGDEQRRLAKALDMYAIEQHSYIRGPRVPSFVVSQPWVVGYNGEQGIPLTADGPSPGRDYGSIVRPRPSTTRSLPLGLGSA